MPTPILSPRSRVPAAKADRLLKCYAERLPPGEAARRTGLSLNTVYEQYGRIRWRLIETGYPSSTVGRQFFGIRRLSVQRHQ